MPRHTLPQIQHAPGLAEAAVRALAVFGGLEGLVKLIKAEFEAAKPGSGTRLKYVEMLVKLLTTNALSGGVEDLETLPDDQLDAELEAAVQGLESRRAIPDEPDPIDADELTE